MKKKAKAAHHTQERASGTLTLLKRSLKLLVEADTPIVLNGKEYKKINFSLGQVIDALHQYATPQEIIDGIVIKDPSTISRNNHYKAEIAAAKTKRADRLRSTDGLHIDFQYGDNDKLTVARLRADIGTLMADKKSLIDENKALKNIMKQAEIEHFLKKDKPIEKVNESISVDQKLTRMLERLLIHGSKTMDIMIEAQKDGKSAKLILQDMEDGGTHLGYVNDLVDLNLEFEKHGKRIMIVNKASVRD